MRCVFCFSAWDPLSLIVLMKDEPVAKGRAETRAGKRPAVRRQRRPRRKAASERGLTPRQNQALFVIAGGRGSDCVTLMDLAEQLRLPHDKVVSLVDGLKAMRLVKQVPEKGNGLQVHVTLTARARRVLEQLDRPARARGDELPSRDTQSAQTRLGTAARIRPGLTFASPACSMPEVED
jgi:DNA-binding MarR family transcriptional regulator